MDIHNTLSSDQYVAPIWDEKQEDAITYLEDTLRLYGIQVDIGGHPPFPTGSKQLSGNFGNLLFLVVFRVLNFWSRFEALNDVFLGMLQWKFSFDFHPQNCISSDRYFQRAIIRLKRRSYAKVTTPGS
jgi:hypothetical protein